MLHFVTFSEGAWGNTKTNIKRGVHSIAGPFSNVVSSVILSPAVNIVGHSSSL